MNSTTIPIFLIPRDHSSSYITRAQILRGKVQLKAVDDNQTQKLHLEAKFSHFVKMQNETQISKKN